MEENREEKAIATVKTGDIAPMDFKDKATGFDEVDESCLALPYLKIGQTSGDYMKRGSAKYIPNLQGGDFFCPMTQDVFGQAVRLVIVKFYRNFSVYESNDSKAKFLGFISVKQFEDEIEPTSHKEKSYFLDPQGHRYVDNRNFVVVNYDHPEYGAMIFTMSSTGIKPSRNWLTQATNIKAPREVKDEAGNVVDTYLEEAPIWTSVWEVRTAYFDDPRGGYYQVAGTKRLGWVKAGGMAKSYEKIFDQMRNYDATQIKALDDEEPEPEEVPVAQRTQAGKPSEAQDPAVSAVMGAMGSKPRKPEDTEEEEIF